MTNQNERKEELRAYCEKYLHTLYLQHRSKMTEPIDEWELVGRVLEGIEEDVGYKSTFDQVHRLLEVFVPAEHRTLTPEEADAKWYELTGLKRDEKGGE